MRRIRCRILSCAAFAGVVSFSVVIPAATRAQVASATDGTIADIVVTAQKREENLQKVPISVTALSSETLISRSLTNVQQLQSAVPGLQFQEQAGIIMPFLRGVGNSSNTISNESSVAVYSDGVYFARLPSAMVELNNVERVEVLKGPQGTLFGRNSTGGVINIITKDPSHDTLIKGTIGYGRFDAFNANVYATTGLSEAAAIDLSVSGKTDNGFGRTIFDRRYGWQDNFLIRSKLLVEPTDTTKITLSGFYTWSEQSGQKTPYPGTTASTISAPFRIITSDSVGFYNSIDNYEFYTFKTWGTSLRVQQELPFARFTSISAYTHQHEFNRFDADHTERDDFYAPIKGTSKEITQEVQLANLAGSSFDWIVGAFYYNNKVDYDTKFIGPALFGPDGLFAPARQKALSYAAFAQATYEIVPRLKLTGGIRYTKDKTSASGELFVNSNPPIPARPPVPDGHVTVNRVTFKAAADYQATDQILVYASFSRGFKSGNFNLLTYDTNVPTKPEGLDAYEIGMKTDLFDRRLRLNAAAFYYDLSSPQVQLVKGGDTGTPTVFFSNAGASRVKGVEVEALAILFTGFTARFNGTYLDSKYKDYKNAPSNTVNLVNGGALALPAIDASGNRTPQAAKWTFSVGGDYVIDTSHGVITLTADFYHNSGFFFEPDNYIRQKAFDLLSAQIKYEPTEHLAVRFWGKNLTGSKYALGEATQAGAGGFTWTPAPPRTYGIAVDFKF